MESSNRFAVGSSIETKAGRQSRTVTFFFLCCFCFLSVPLSRADTDEPGSISAETNGLLSREPYEFPFSAYQQWLDFMDRSPDPDWQSEAMKELVLQKDFDRYSAQQSLKTERIVYASQGLRINGFMITPHVVDQPLPVILFAHGGVAEWGRITFFELLEMHRLAEQGYVVLATALRGEMGSEGQPNLGAGDLADLMALLGLTDQLQAADGNRVGLWGFSRGGGLSYRMLAASKQVTAAVLVGAPSDLVNSPRREEFDEFVYPGIVDGYAEDKDAALRALSAVFWPETIDRSVNILLLHGAKDDRVDVQESLQMANHFARLQQPFRLVVYEGGSHTLVEHTQAYRSEIDDWFARYLKP